MTASPTQWQTPADGGWQTPADTDESSAPTAPATTAPAVAPSATPVKPAQTSSSPTATSALPVAANPDAPSADYGLYEAAPPAPEPGAGIVRPGGMERTTPWDNADRSAATTARHGTTPTGQAPVTPSYLPQPATPQPATPQPATPLSQLPSAPQRNGQQQNGGAARPVPSRSLAALAAADHAPPAAPDPGQPAPPPARVTGIGPAAASRENLDTLFTPTPAPLPAAEHAAPAVAATDPAPITGPASKPAPPTQSAPNLTSLFQTPATTPPVTPATPAPVPVMASGLPRRPNPPLALPVNRGAPAVPVTGAALLTPPTRPTNPTATWPDTSINTDARPELPAPQHTTGTSPLDKLRERVTALIPAGLADTIAAANPFTGRARRLTPTVGSRMLVSAGTALSVVGLVVMALVAYQRWGTDLVNAREQDVLADEFGDEVEAADAAFAADDPTFSIAALPTTTTTQAPQDSSATTTAPADIAPPPDANAAPGSTIARITAPKIGLDKIVVAGTERSHLKKGPGWMIGTSFPGEAGNTVISGHRTTWGAPFHDLHKLAAGDTITVSVAGSDDAVYEVRDSFTVAPTDVYVAAQTDGARLTLTTCHPIGSAKQRLIIQAELVSGANAATATPADTWTRSTPT